MSSRNELKRIIWHWSGGTNNPSPIDKERYHFLIDGLGGVYAGDHTPEDNISTIDDNYAAHTRNCNTGSIAISLCGMAGATERPFWAGRYPLKQIQITSLVNFTADLCKAHNIPVSRETTLSHAEVQPTLKIAQRQKWDITWLPDMLEPEDPIHVGDRLRERVNARIKSPTVDFDTPTPSNWWDEFLSWIRP